VRLRYEADKPLPTRFAIGTIALNIRRCISIYSHREQYMRLGETAEVVSGADSGSSVLVGPTSSSWGKRVGEMMLLARDASPSNPTKLPINRRAHQL
jgi:hypothetical protein